MSSTPKRGPRNIAPWQIVRYRLPWAGKVSILHRVSGALLFLALPGLLWAFEKSVSFYSLSDYVGLSLKVAALVLGWAYLHHFFAGLRYLLLDLHVGVDKVSSATSAKVVLALSTLTTALLTAKLFEVF